MRLNQKKGGVLLSYGQMASNVLVKFIYTPFLLHSLGQNEYGLFSLIMSIVGYLAILDMGFGSTVTRYTVKYITEGEKEKLYRLYGTLSVVYIGIGLIALAICVLINLSAPSLFSKTMTEAEISKIKLMIVLCGVNLLFSFPLQISRSVIVAHERFIFKNGLEFLRTYIQPATMVLLLYLFHIKSVGAITIVTFFNLLTYAIYYIYAVKKLNFRFYLKYFSPQMAPMLLKFSVWMFCVMLFEQLQYNSGQFVIGLFQDSATIAIWGIVMIFILNYRSLSTAISNVYLPTFISYKVKNNTDKISSTIYKMTRYQTIILISILLNFILFGNHFLVLWAGETYSDAYGVCIIIMVPMFLGLILDFSYIYQVAANDLVYRIITLFTGYLVSFVVVYYYLGITLLSYAIVIACSIIFGQIVMPIFYIKTKMQLKLSNVFYTILRIVVFPSLITFLSSFIVNQYLPLTLTKFCVSISLYNIVLFSTLIFIGLERHEVRWIINKIK